MWMEFVFDIWTYLLQRLSHGDKFCIANLQEEIQNCRQGDSTISQYYTRLQILWKELFLYRTILVCTCASPCTCGLLSKIQKECDDDCVIKFLRGLNDEFSQVRSQIMLMKPMPTLVKTFSLILQQEREFKVTFHSNSQDSTANLAFHEGHGKIFRNGFSNNRGRGCFPWSGGRNPRYCDHCHRTNHTSDSC